MDSQNREVHPPPRAAAFSGIVFSLLLLIGLVLIRLAIPDDPLHSGAWLNDPVRRRAMNAALELAPFSGIAFLWFLGTIRSRLGVLEDRLFSTVFVGSGFLFIACLYGATALGLSAVKAVSAGDLQFPSSDAYALLRRTSVTLMNVFAIKMAGVFTFSLCSIGLRTNIFHRWISYLGIGCGILLLAVISSWLWITLLFPIWTLILSVGILLNAPPSSEAK